MNVTNQSFFVRENPVMGECASSALFFTLPRRCGHWLAHEGGPAYHGRGTPRPFPDHPRFLFQYTVSGEGELRRRGHRTPLTPGDMMILQLPEEVEYLRPPHSPRWEFLYVSFWHPFAVRMIRENLPQNVDMVRLDTSGRAVGTLWELFRFFRDTESFDRYAVSEAGYRFLLNICREIRERGTGHGGGSLLPRVQAYCHVHLAEPVTSEELAAHCGYSRGHFSRLFREETGMTPLEFIRKTKLDAAVRIFQSEQISIKELAARCGFYDQGYFTRCFRACHGITPHEYFQLM